MTDLGVSNYSVYTDVVMRCMYQGQICYMTDLDEVIIQCILML